MGCTYVCPFFYFEIEETEAKRINHIGISIYKKVNHRKKRDVIPTLIGNPALNMFFIAHALINKKMPFSPRSPISLKNLTNILVHKKLTGK